MEFNKKKKKRNEMKLWTELRNKFIQKNTVVVVVEWRIKKKLNLVINNI